MVVLDFSFEAEKTRMMRDNWGNISNGLLTPLLLNEDFHM